jgi:nucleotide-binding universal stress UspA family protein
MIDWEPIVTTGPVTNTISGLIASKAADLAIAATHGRSGLKRLILGSVTERLIRTVNCPLLIVTPPEDGHDAETVQQAGFKNILVGCDFSADSSAALQYGFSLAQEYQSVLHLVHVIEPVAYREVILPPGLLDDVKTDLDEHLTAQLEELAPDEARNWCEVKTICLTGRPFEELTKYAARHSVDLVVMGVRGRGLVETMLLGATTDRVLRRVSCPVLSVNPLKSSRVASIADTAAAETL